MIKDDNDLSGRRSGHKYNNDNIHNEYTAQENSSFEEVKRRCFIDPCDLETRSKIRDSDPFDGTMVTENQDLNNHVILEPIFPTN
jgi:hypothetical protein